MTTSWWILAKPLSTCPINGFSSCNLWTTRRPGCELFDLTTLVETQRFDQRPRDIWRRVCCTNTEAKQDHLIFFFFFLSTWSPWNIAATEYSELKFKPPQIKSSKIVSFEKQSVLHSWGLKSLWKFQCSRSRQKCKFKSRTSIFPSIIFDWKFRGLCLYLAAGVRKNEFLILNSEFPKTNLTTLIHYLFPLNGQLLLLLLLLFLLKPMNMNRHLMCRLPFIPPCTTNLRFHYLFVQSNTQGMTLFNMKLWHLSCTNFQLYLFIAPYIQNCNNRRFTIQQNIQYKMKIKQLKYNIFEQ